MAEHPLTRIANKLGPLNRVALVVPTLSALTLASFLLALLVSALAPAAAAQPSPPPPPGPPAATAGPPPNIAGEWSITRTWFRSCPRCGFPVIRTTNWVITQTGQTVSVDRGPRGSIAGAPGGGYLTLAGPETGGFDVQRFWYGTLWVEPSGDSFQGQFAGSETIQNPCGSSPPIVTCLVSAGWVRAVRIRPRATIPPPASPTATPSSTTPTTATPTLAAPSATATPSASAAATIAATATASPTSRPLRVLYLPATGAGDD